MVSDQEQETVKHASSLNTRVWCQLYEELDLVFSDNRIFQRHDLIRSESKLWAELSFLLPLQVVNIDSIEKFQIEIDFQCQRLQMLITEFIVYYKKERREVF